MKQSIDDVSWTLAEFRRYVWLTRAGRRWWQAVKRGLLKCPLKWDGTNYGDVR